MTDATTPDAPANENKYGQVEIPGIPPDEPIFILRAKDWVSKRLLEVYREMCAQAGSPQEHLDGVQAAWDRFHHWRETNDDKIQVPGTNLHPEDPSLSGQEAPRG